MSITRILPLTTILITAGFILPASASHNFRPGVHQYRYTKRALSRVESRIVRQRARIRSGVATGELTRRERRVLNREQRNIARMLRRHLRDRVLRPWEAASIERAQNRASRMIRRLKNNNRVARFYRSTRRTDRTRAPRFDLESRDRFAPPRRPKLKVPPRPRPGARCRNGDPRCNRGPVTPPPRAAPPAPVPEVDEVIPEPAEPPVVEEMDTSTESGTTKKGKKGKKGKKAKKGKKGKKKKPASSDTVLI